MLENYIATCVIDLSALVFLSFIIRGNSTLREGRKRPFYVGLGLTALIILAEAGTLITEGDARLRAVHIICNLVGFALTPVLPLVLIAIFDQKGLKLYRLTLLPTAINALMAVLSPWLGLIFEVDAGGNYSRGSFFPVFVVAYMLNLLLLLLIALMTAKKLHYPIKARIIAFALFVIAATGVQLVLPGMHLSWHCVTLILVLYYLTLSEFDGSIDPLTGLYNRAAYEKTVNKLSGKKPYSVIVMDINDFKEINDTYGHESGDMALKKVAKIVRETFGRRSICFRVGGDEFHVISGETDSFRIEQWLKNMERRLNAGRERDYRIPTVACGYSIFKSGRAADFQSALKAADGQMYYYKKVHKYRGSPPWEKKDGEGED